MQTKLFSDTKILLHRCEHKLLSVYFIKNEPLRKNASNRICSAWSPFVCVCFSFIILVSVLCEVLTKVDRYEQIKNRGRPIPLIPNLVITRLFYLFCVKYGLPVSSTVPKNLGLHDRCRIPLCVISSRLTILNYYQRFPVISCCCPE